MDTREIADRQLTSRADRLTIEGRDGYAAALAALESAHRDSDGIIKWISERAPVTRDYGSFARSYVRRLALAAVKAYEGTKHSAAIILRHWNMGCDPGWPDGEMSAIVDEACTEWQREQSRRVEPWQKRARARAIEKRKAQDATKAASDLNKGLAEALNTSVRYVRMLRREGTTLRDTAETMARVLGGSPDDYMRRPRRRGRRADLVALFMKTHADGCDFTDFIADPPDDLRGDAREMVDVLQARRAGDFESLEALAGFVGTWEFESVDITWAADVWRAYKRWRIARVAELACLAVEQGEDLR